mmetsp:Transcript_32551/g.59078  ORF Transcript_32551/g.59078 Transcript_32551/m.59078 type:complete len:195 (+) Transcript_32551:96-680(+)
MRLLLDSGISPSLTGNHVGNNAYASFPPSNNNLGSSNIVKFFSNGPFFAAFFAFFVAQLSKVIVFYYESKKWEWSHVIASGGMPSSHTAFVVGLTTAVGFKEGAESSIFAICVVLSLIVMYDATGVRLHAGRQATVLNVIVAEMLPADHPVNDNGRLRDSLGHTPIQVCAGAVTGFIVSYLVCLTLITPTHTPS